MIRRTGLVVCALALALAPIAGAGAADRPGITHPAGSGRSVAPVTGTVVRVDEPNRVIVLDDARMIRVSEDGTVLVEDRPVPLSGIRPGTRVVIVSGQPVVFRDGRYVAATEPVEPSAAVAVVAPPPVAAAPVPILVTEGRVSGRVSRIDAPAGLLVFDDGRTVLLGPQNVIMANGRPVGLAAVQPRMSVTVTAGNPVVYKNGRYALLNEGYRDADTGSTLAWDSKYEGYEAILPNAGMDIQAGG